MYYFFWAVWKMAALCSPEWSGAFEVRRSVVNQVGMIVTCSHTMACLVGLDCFFSQHCKGQRCHGNYHPVQCLHVISSRWCVGANRFTISLLLHLQPCLNGNPVTVLQADEIIEIRLGCVSLTVRVWERWTLRSRSTAGSKANIVVCLRLWMCGAKGRNATF